MHTDTIFNLCSIIAFTGWVVLLFISPFVIQVDKFLVAVIITLLAIVYSWLIFTSFHTTDIKNFGSLDGVMSLFQNKTLVTAGWVHYLAFDLLTGIWIKRNSLEYNIPHWLIIPSLLFTFMLGPLGLLLYLIIRFIKTGNFISSKNF